MFEAPSAGQKLLLQWTATYQEGATDNNGNSSPSDDSQTGTAETALVTSTSVKEDKRLRSYFAASTGAVLFTCTGVPSGLPSGDAWTTTVKIPKGLADEAQIVEDDNGGNSCGPVLTLCLPPVHRRQGAPRHASCSKAATRASDTTSPFAP